MDTSNVSSAPHEVPGALRAPAIGMIALGAMGVFFAITLTAASMFNPMRPEEWQELAEALPPEFREAAYWAERTDLATTLAMGVINTVVSVAILLGGYFMLNARNWGWCIAAAVLALLPCCGITCCCFPASMPIGIWALVVLLDQHNKQAFR